MRTNRLANETSPYLLQHAHNPVDWYAWGPEAFAAAREQNKPIFLSVGYSTCYWCHVMERQCFEVESIAAEMNQRFINIKVDREERPDVDQLYMTAVQVLTRHGGWPMSVFLLPDLRLFYGGTYFPPTDMHGRPGFVTILRAIEDAFHNRRDDVNKSADQLLNILKQIAEPVSPKQPITIDDRFIENLIDRSVSDYDPVNGGFGSAPKFPRETLLELVLQSKIQNPRSKILHSLDSMANGGIRDHLGGGFHRYSTDAQWLVPHFEIMLYDNAMLGWCYVEAFSQTNNERYARVARDIFDFILREMTSPQGAFYTAQDAEVDAMEGGSYLWTGDEIRAILTEEPDKGMGAIFSNADAEKFLSVYGLNLGPNFADPHHGNGQPDKNVLYLPDGPAGENDPIIIRMCEFLYHERLKRKQPLMDTKIITSWNAMMIRALAHGGKILGEKKYTDAAEKAARFLLDQHRAQDGSLFRTSRDGVKKYAGFLDDYAFFAQALLALGWKDQAAEIAKIMQEKFGDEKGGFYFTDKSADDLIVRQKVASDSPLPSGNAIATMVMLELGEREIAQRAIETFARQLEQQGEGMSAMVQAAMDYMRRCGPLAPSRHEPSDIEKPPSPDEQGKQVVVVDPKWIDSSYLELTLKIRRPFHLNSTELRVEGGVVEYPPGETLHDGAILRVRFNQPVKSSVRIMLKYQACDESACLAMVSKEVKIPAP